MYDSTTYTILLHVQLARCYMYDYIGSTTFTIENRLRILELLRITE